MTHTVDLGVKLKIVIECTSGVTFMHSLHTPRFNTRYQTRECPHQERRTGTIGEKYQIFGVWKPYTMHESTLKLTMKTVGGTPNFMAPEL